VKFKIALLSLAVVAFLAGCGNNSTPTGTEETSLEPAPPPAPTALRLTVDPASKVRYLEWDASSAPNLTGYEVFYYEPNPNRLDSYVYLDYTVPPRWSLANITMGTAKSFRVRAVTQAGKRSAFTSEVTVDPISSDPVSPPEPTGPPKHQTNIE